MKNTYLNKVVVSSDENDYDFNIGSIGLEETSPDKKVGPYVRKDFVIHYILGGSGLFNGTRISRGSGFLVCPDKLHSYSSDSDSPLKYGWISFCGNKSGILLEKAGLTLENQIFECTWVDQLDDIFSQLCTTCQSADTDEYLLGCFHILMSFHIKAQKDKNKAMLHPAPRKEHIITAIEYINNNYNRKLSVSEVASQLYISPHYLSNLFHEELNISPQQYIMNVRMKRASELLVIKDLLITDIAHSVGYGDSLNFSKIFKRFYGISPRKYRDSL